MEQLAEMPDSEVATDAEESSTKAPDTSFSPDDPIESDSTDSLLEPVDDDEEIEHDGEKYKIPKALKDAFLRQQDYTQKTQSVAEQRKEVEAHKAELQQREQVQRQNIAEYAQAYALDEQLKQYAGIDWNALIDSDPVQAMKFDRQMKDLQQRRDQVVASVTEKQRAQQFEQQQDTARRIESGRAVLEREIKGWSRGNDLDKSLQEYAVTLDVPDLGKMILHAPILGVLINKAMQFDQLMKKQASAKPAPAPQEKPVTRITASKGTAVKDPSKMSDSEFAQFRKRQIAQRN
jgi:hypothetical protein